VTDTRKEQDHVTTQQDTVSAAPTEAVQPSGVNHLVLNVKDIERSHAFWTEIIGFRQVAALPEDRPMKMRFYVGQDGARHHDLALAQVANPDEIPDADGWNMRGTRTGVNHVAIKYPDRESWLRQITFLQSKGVPFHSRVDHGMTHSVYISDPDGHGIEVLYELPAEVWENDIASALVWAKRLPNEGPAALEDDTNYEVFGKSE
jgi:catechol 2,3-dioxygenase